MPFERFLIAPQKEGIRTDMLPWQIPEEAYTNQVNCYTWRGRIKKRFGALSTGNNATSPALAALFSKLAVLLGITDGAGHLTGAVPGVITGAETIGQQFSIGNEIFTVRATGNPVVLATTGATPTRNYDTTTRVFTFTGAAAGLPVYWYPNQPVMGLTTYSTTPLDAVSTNPPAINSGPAYAFDTQFVYTFTGAQWIAVAGTPTWHSVTNPIAFSTAFFWTANWNIYDATANLYKNYMFVTNFQSKIGTPVPATDDPMYTYDGTVWASFSPFTKFLSDGLSFVQTAKIIVPFKGSLLLLNTIEAIWDGALFVNRWFPNRVRFSHDGSPFAANAWLEYNESIGAGVINNFSGGGVQDAATDEQIITVEFIKDRLIVFFEKSTWEIVYSGNASAPFRWQKLNTELGATSLLGTIPFDTNALTMADVGIHSCNGSNVKRIDQKIPDDVFEINQTSNGVTRVSGIRDYFSEVVYWTFPSFDEPTNAPFPNRVLVYNYQNDTWAFNDDSITCFGYFYQQQALTWQSLTFTWENWTMPWSQGVSQLDEKNVIAGNQQGYIFIIQRDFSRNAPALTITDMAVNGADINLNIVNHNVTAGVNDNDTFEWILIENALGVNGVNGNIYKVIAVIDKDNITVTNLQPPPPFTGVYTGGGTATLVSQILLDTKQFNPYVGENRNLFVQKVDFAVQSTAAAQFYVDYSVNSSSLSMRDEAIVTGSEIGTGILETSPFVDYYPIEAQQEILWHPMYFYADGEFIQLFIYLNDAMMLDRNSSLADFEISGLLLTVQSTTSRLQ